MSMVLQTLKALSGKEHEDVCVELLDDDSVVLIQGDIDGVQLDRRQRQELSRVLEEWPPK